MSSGVVDRAEWAQVIHEELDTIPKRKKAPLARKLGFAERTIDRWLEGSVEVSEASVRQVAERSGRSAMDLLIRVGYWTRDELPPPEISPEDEWVIQVIQSATWLDKDTRDKLAALTLAQEREDRAQREQRLQRQLELLRRQREDVGE